MSNREPSFWEYVKAAFFARKRVKGLGEVPINVLALFAIGVAGLVHPALWLIGAGLEVGFVSVLSQNPRFQNLVRGQRLRESANDFVDRIEDIVARLSEGSQERSKRLEAKCDQIREMGAMLAGVSLSNIDHMKETGLNSLLMIHAKLLLSRESVHSNMRESNASELENKLKQAEKRLASATSDAMKRSLEANIAILKKRIKYHHDARENLQVIDAELERIENQVDLIREEVAVSRDPGVLSARIDAVATTIGEANQFLIANEVLLGDLGGGTETSEAFVPSRRTDTVK